MGIPKNYKGTKLQQSLNYELQKYRKDESIDRKSVCFHFISFRCVAFIPTGLSNRQYNFCYSLLFSSDVSQAF